jgi:hypothetical protein
MRDTFVDVRLEVPTHELQGLPDGATQVLERMRDSADRLCAESGGRLRTDRAPEIVVQEAQHPLLGDFTLFASRWAVVAPERI